MVLMDEFFGPAFPNAPIQRDPQSPYAGQQDSPYNPMSNQRGLFTSLFDQQPALSQFFGKTNAAGYGAGDPGMNFGAAGNQTPGFWQNIFGASEGAGGIGGGAGGSAGGGAGGGMWSSAGSAGPVGAMIMATLGAQAAGDSAFERGSVPANIQDMFMPSVTGPLEEGNYGNLIGQGLGLNPITTWIFPRKGESEGSAVFGK